MPPKAPDITDKYRLSLLYTNKDVPDFATRIAEFAVMWDGAGYSASDKRSIYESVLLVLLRKVSSISDQEQLEPVMLEMALVKFLELWLGWGTDAAKAVGLFERGPVAKTATDPSDIAIYGNNVDFLQSIAEIDDEEAIKYMTASKLSVATVTKAAASATQKLSKPTPADLEKVSQSMCHADNVAQRDLDSPGVNTYITTAMALAGKPGASKAAVMMEQYQFLTKNATVYALMILGFRIGLKVKNPRNMEYLLGHMADARMRAKSLMIKWMVHMDVKQGLTMDGLIDKILAFKRDADGKFWLTHYAYVLLGRRSRDGRQRLPILGSYAELAEIYSRAFQLMAVLHGDHMFGVNQQVLFLEWMKEFFDKSALELNQAFRSFNDKIWVYVGNSIQEVGSLFLGDISRESPMLVMAPFYQVHGSPLPLDAMGAPFHEYLRDRYTNCHQIYTSGMVGNEDCGRGHWGIDPTIVTPSKKNNWNSVLVNPNFQSNLPSPLFAKALGGEIQPGGGPRSTDMYLPAGSIEQAPPSPIPPPQPKWQRPALPGDTPPVPIDLTAAEGKGDRKGPSPHQWNVDERTALVQFTKVTYGMNGNGPVMSASDTSGGQMCCADARHVMFPTVFYPCQYNAECKFRHGLAATTAGDPYLDGSEAQKDAMRAFVPTYTAAIAEGTLRMGKVPKKGKGKGKGK